MTNHVLVMSLGPVQEFIASARRCRDLWFGSWLLSELAKAVAAGAVHALGGGADALVFPAAGDAAALDAGSPMSVANKLVVRVPGDAERVRCVAEQARERMRARLTTLRDARFARVGRDDPLRARHFLVGPATQQVEEAFELLWAAVEESGDPGGYARARSEAERLLVARKNARSWVQPAWTQPPGRGDVPKSSLDGVRESVLHEDLYERPLDGPARRAALEPERRRRWYGVHGSERLCGVGVLKRWGVRVDAAGRHEVERFFSTPHLAALPLMHGIDGDARRDPALANAWAELCEAAGAAVEELDVVPGDELDLFRRVDGAILFAQRLAETLLDCGHEPDGEAARRAREAQRTFLHRAARGEPLPYYAILVADGDGMGAVIDAQATAEAHRELSAALDAFARGARRVVSDHSGSLVYSGGDDVLALLPLHQAVECGAELARLFAEKLGRWKAANGTRATLSAGLAIVHYLEPMGSALALARRAEQIAKRHPGKEALAVALDKRSGDISVICGHWGELVPRLLDLAGLHRANAIPAKTAHELARLGRLESETSGLGSPRGDQERHEKARSLRAIRVSEAHRILGRKRAHSGSAPIAAEDLARLRGYLGDDPVALGQAIRVADILAKAKAQAAPRGEEGA